MSVSSAASFAKSGEITRFDHECEDALVVVTHQLGALIALLREDDTAEALLVAAPGAETDDTVTARHYSGNDSVVLGHDYLIKGVAVEILWRLLREDAATGRTDFSMRELRLDRTLKLPVQAEGLDARFAILRRRLEERGAWPRIGSRITS